MFCSHTHILLKKKKNTSEHYITEEVINKDTRRMNTTRRNRTKGLIKSSLSYIVCNFILFQHESEEGYWDSKSFARAPPDCHQWRKLESGSVMSALSLPPAQNFLPVHVVNQGWGCGVYTAGRGNKPEECAQGARIKYCRIYPRGGIRTQQWTLGMGLETFEMYIIGGIRIQQRTLWAGIEPCIHLGWGLNPVECTQ